MQWGQRVASIFISLLQKGHTFVVGSAGASAVFFLPIFEKLLISFTNYHLKYTQRRKIYSIAVLFIKQMFDLPVFRKEDMFPNLPEEEDVQLQMAVDQLKSMLGIQD